MGTVSQQAGGPQPPGDTQMAHKYYMALRRVPTYSIAAAVCTLMTSPSWGADCDPATLQRLASANTRPVVVLSQLDIDGDGLPGRGH
jgi:hypothetical protein